MSNTQDRPEKLETPVPVSGTGLDSTVTDSHQPDPSLENRRFPMGIFVSGFTAFNFLTPLLMEASGMGEEIMPVIAIMVGSMMGQCGLLAIWGVLGPQNAAIRLSLTTAIGAFLMLSLGIGLAVAEAPGDDFGEMISTGLFLPLFLTAVQLPIWVFRLIAGGRIVHARSHAARSAPPPQQFGLRDVMVGTVVAAVALSLANSGLAVFDTQGPEGWLPLLVGCGFFAVTSAFATLPCLWAAMIAKQKEAGIGLIVIYTLLLCLLLSVVLALLSRGMMPPVIVVTLFFFLATLMAVIYGTLFTARLYGYEFISRRRPLAAVDKGNPFGEQDEASDVTGEGGVCDTLSDGSLAREQPSD